VDLSRRIAVRATKRSFLIIHRGALEEHYLHWVIRSLDHSHVQVASAPALGHTPIQAVRLAAKMKREAREKASAYDEVWCIFDDEIGLAEAQEFATKRGIGTVVSSPDFAVWLLFHFIDEIPESQLPSDVLSGYLKDLEVAPAERMNQLAGLYELAKSNAKSAGLVEEPGARSDFYLLIDSLRSSLQEFENTDEVRDI
jgi:RloB-like protein